MASGTTNQIGYGQAQILDMSGFNPMQAVQAYNEQKGLKENQKRYDDAKKEQEKKELYGILSDSLNPRDFNTLLHGRVRDEISRLAEKINTQGGDYGSIYLEARQKANELASVSDKLNSAKSLMDASEKEWGSYEGINPINIRKIADNMLANDLQSGRINENTNYFDEAMNKYGHEYGITSGSDAPNFKFQAWEKQTPSKKVVSINSLGGRRSGTWKGEYYPAFYSVDMGSADDMRPPTVKLNEEETGLGITGYEKMLNNDAYNRYIANRADYLRLNREVQNRFGKNIDLQSETAEKLRRSIAREKVLKYLPVNPDIVSEQKAPSVFTTNYIQNGGNRNDVTDIGKYDVLGQYAGKIKEENIGGKKNWAGQDVGGNNVRIILAKDVSDSHKKLFGNARPKVDNKIGAYYEVLDNGDWLGNGDQVIYRLDAAKNNQSTYTASEEKRGGLNLRVDNPDYLPPYVPSKNSPTNTSYKIKGKTYTEDELLKMGYNIDQIKPYKQ